MKTAGFQAGCTVLDPFWNMLRATDQVWHDSPEGVWEAEWCHACDGQGTQGMNERIRKDSVSCTVNIQKYHGSWKTLTMKKFLALFLALEIRRHSVFEDQWNESIFFVGGGGKSKIRFGGWMPPGGMDERWATEDVAWDFAPWDHKDDSGFDPGEPEKNGEVTSYFWKSGSLWPSLTYHIPNFQVDFDDLNVTTRQPSTPMSVIGPFFQLPPWGTRSEGRRLGASSLKIKWPRIHPLSLHHRTSSKSNLVYLGQNFWVAILKLLSL